jgi:hypothetical protein
MNYLNKALDLFNTAIVTPIYYVMFTTLTCAASMIMMREQQSATQLVTEASGFVTIVCGTFLLHTIGSADSVDVPLEALARLLTRGGAGAVALAPPASCEAKLAPENGGAAGRDVALELGNTTTPKATALRRGAAGQR